ncbi:hypothetical protein FRC03_005762 [Tulasnella sp. 419]|nr:hypothetical protein FRC03_005762 [Tulasnella sp. 419]
MRKEKHHVQDIHFFSWSQDCHGLTKSGQDWRYRQKDECISIIRSDCVGTNGVDVDWRLEFICNPKLFTLFLVHGLEQEAGLMIDYPVEIIAPKDLQPAYPSRPKICVSKCQSMQTGAEIDWRDSQALSMVTPYHCSLCIEVTEDLEDMSIVVD